MNPITATNVTIQFLKGDTYQDYGCAEEISINFKMATKSVRTYGSGTYRKPRGQSHDWTLSVSGLIVFDEPTLPGAFDILEYWRAMSGVQFRLFFDEPITGTLKLIEGVALPVDVGLSGGAEGFANGGLEFEGDGDVSIRDAIINCPSTITSIELSDDQTKILITGHTGEPVRYDYSIDGSGFDTAFIFTDPAEIPLPEGIAVGNHDIIIIPVCENGDYGTEFNGSFIIEDAPDVCAPPSSIVFSSITETGLTVSWSAPDPAPASGYHWELFDTETGGFVYNDSGVPMTTSVDITGLSEGVQYTFRVRSLCGPGEDYSIWVEDTFTTAVTSETATFDWEFIELGGANGGFQAIGSITGGIEFTGTPGEDSFIVNPIQVITLRCTGVAGTNRQLWVIDETLSSTLYNNTDEANQEFVFTPTAGHLYQIIARVTPA